jgi:hypothetical protein
MSRSLHLPVTSVKCLRTTSLRSFMAHRKSLATIGLDRNAKVCEKPAPWKETGIRVLTYGCGR